MKVLIINASPRNDGNTSLLLDEIKKTFMILDVSYEEIKIGNKVLKQYN